MMLRYAFRSLLAMLLIGNLSLSAAETAPPTTALRAITVLPAKVTLTGPRASQQLVVLGEFVDGRQWDFTRTAHYTADDSLAVSATGVVTPLRDGATSLTVKVGDQSAVVPVTVQQYTADVPVSFSREIVPVLTKTGCNQGACHGAALGRGGFRLSLRSFDPAFDHSQIIQSAEGRRVVLPDPDRSTLLLKAALTLEHAGGERFTVNSREYNLIRQWLADGAPEPSANDATVESLSVLPSARLLTPGEQQQYIVQAVWSDGTIEDVTAAAQFDALNDGVASVSANGLLTAKDRGETHIMVRFAGRVGIARVTLPYSVSAKEPLPRHNFIDDKLIAKWKDLGLTPSPLCDDAEFLRRASLDLIGTLPTPEEVRSFLADKAANKRARVVDQLLGRPEFVDFWSLKWGDLLQINRTRLQDKGMWSFHNWVRAQIRDGVPMDQFVREIITAEGSTYTEGPANFFRTGNGATDWSENVSQIFLGVRVQCAKCHHHPFEKWSQDDYYGMAAFFSRLGTKNSQEFGLFGRETVVFLRPTGEVSHPRRGGVVKPRPFDADETDDRFDRRRKLAEWLTTKDNPFFARNLVNRFWGYLMGRGLVEPLDDMRATNPASNPELLDALAKDLAEHQFDLKHLLRTIVGSRAYQLSSTATPGNSADAMNVHHTRYTVKRLTAEQLADALDYATGTQEKYAGLPLGTRAIQMPDTNVRSFLMDVFGRPSRQITCECERTSQPNIAQALHLLNGDFLNRKLAAPTGRIETLLKNKQPTTAIVEELYLTTLSRPPRPEELTKAEEWVASAPTPREGFQDLLWALFNSREFLFNH